MAGARPQLGGLGRAARRLSLGALAELPADEVQGGLEPQARGRLQAVDEVLDAGAMGALDVAGDLAPGARGDDAALGERHEGVAAQPGERAVHDRRAQLGDLREVVAVHRGQRTRERTEHPGVLEGHPVLVQAERGELRGAVEQVLEHFGEVGGEAGGPGFRVGRGGERRHAPHHTART